MNIMKLAEYWSESYICWFEIGETLHCKMINTLKRSVFCLKMLTESIFFWNGKNESL